MDVVRGGEYNIQPWKVAQQQVAVRDYTGLKCGMGRITQQSELGGYSSGAVKI